MVINTFDKALWLIILGSLAALLITSNDFKRVGHTVAKERNKAIDREITYRARVDLIKKIYEPAEVLYADGHKQEALLKLDDLLRAYPGEAHGYILQGRIQRDMGAHDEAISSFVEGVKLNGDYVDDKSPLSCRPEIQSLVDQGKKSIVARLAANPDNRSAAVVLQRINYLKSRLAGGCE